MKQQEPNIFEFLDFRDFLKQKLESLKAHPGFSARAFARRAGFKSPSYLKMVIDGKRKLTQASIQQVIKGFKLNKSAAKFFEILVHFNQEDSLEEKQLYYESLLQFKKFLKIQKTTSDQHDYFAHWYHVAVREALVGGWEVKKLSLLAKSLGISSKEVQEAVDLLIRLELCEKRSTKYFAKDVSLQTPRQMQSLNVRAFHKSMIEKALESVDGVATEKRDITGLTISLTEAEFEEVRERIAQFRRELNAVYSGRKGDRQVYQFNFQAIPLMKQPERKKKV